MKTNEKTEYSPSKQARNRIKCYLNCCSIYKYKTTIFLLLCRNIANKRFEKIKRHLLKLYRTKQILTRKLFLKLKQCNKKKKSNLWHGNVLIIKLYGKLMPSILCTQIILNIQCFIFWCEEHVISKIALHNNLQVPEVLKSNQSLVF